MSVKFSKDHEWIRVDGNTATVGITIYAQEQLGDVVFVEVPEAGKQVEQGEETAVVESVKAASEIFAPVSGEITAGNPVLEDEPATINADAEGEGWIFKMTLSDASQLDDLMDAAAYVDYVAGLE
ncbi:MAG: glycine cleavage system protein GcvH [Rhodospirillales bacterium]|nr:glycine cleavage system protein GcvH [Rhodospirillales bacterium]